MSSILFYTAIALIGGMFAFLSLVVGVGLLAYFLEAKGFIKNEMRASESNS